MILYILFCASMAFADVIEPGSILKPPSEQWKCSAGNLSLGFHSRENDKYVVGISFANINDNTLVWTAGRGEVDNAASLRFQSDGDLVLYDNQNDVVWKSNTANKGVVSAEMRDNGNFVLLNRSSNVVWDTFGNPTDTLLVDQAFTVGKSLSANSYSVTLESGGNLRLKWRNNVTYWNASASSELNDVLTLSLTSQGILKISNSSGLFPRQTVHSLHVHKICKKMCRSALGPTASTNVSESKGQDLDLPPQGCSRIKVELNKPIGIALEEDKAGNIFVTELVKDGNAEKSGLVDIGDQLIATSAIVYGSEEVYQGVKVRKGMQMVRLNVRGERFETVMAAIGTHPGHIKVTLELQKCKDMALGENNGGPSN